MKNSLSIIGLMVLATMFTASCNNQSTSKQVNNEDEAIENVDIQDNINYLEIGKVLAIKTKSALSKNLIAAITENGSAGAVEFCNIKAIPITDSMSLVLNAKLKRVSDLPRNTNNQANEEELDYIKKWKEAKANGKEHAPIVKEIDGKKVGYYPIITNQMCIQCHGKPEIDIKSATFKKITKLYPSDRAIGYAENEIRGIFVVEMDKK